MLSFVDFEAFFCCKFLQVTVPAVLQRGSSCLKLGGERCAHLKYGPSTDRPESGTPLLGTKGPLRAGDCSCLNAQMAKVAAGRVLGLGNCLTRWLLGSADKEWVLFGS